MNETKGMWIRQHKFIFSDEHPPRLIAKTNDLNIGSKAQDANGDLIVAAVNNCKSVNPDCPEHVAEAIKPMYEALKACLDKDMCWEEIELLILDALALADRKGN